MGQIILGIDPGTTKSAYVVFDATRRIPLLASILPNKQLLDLLGHWPGLHPERLIVEAITAAGMAGKSTFETCFWSGRFVQRWEETTVYPWERLTRQKIKGVLLGRVCGNDTKVRASLIGRYGGAEKALQGPLAGFSSHTWAALAVCVVWTELNGPLFNQACPARAAAPAARIVDAIDQNNGKRWKFYA